MIGRDVFENTFLSALCFPEHQRHAWGQQNTDLFPSPCLCLHFSSLQFSIHAVPEKWREWLTLAPGPVSRGIWDGAYSGVPGFPEERSSLLVH